MNEQRIRFTQNDSWANWRADHSEEWPQAGLCADGLREYVAIPEDCSVLEAVFTVEKSSCDNFKLEPSSSNRHAALDTVRGLGLYGSAIHMIDEMYERGYRYVHVEY